MNVDIVCPVNGEVIEHYDFSKDITKIVNSHMTDNHPTWVKEQSGNDWLPTGGFYCPVCGPNSKLYFRSSHLTKHMRSHPDYERIGKIEWVKIKDVA